MEGSNITSTTSPAPGTLVESMLPNAPSSGDIPIQEKRDFTQVPPNKKNTYSFFSFFKFFNFFNFSSNFNFFNFFRTQSPPSNTHCTSSSSDSTPSVFTTSVKQVTSTNHALTDQNTPLTENSLSLQHSESPAEIDKDKIVINNTCQDGLEQPGADLATEPLSQQLSETPSHQTQEEPSTRTTLVLKEINPWEHFNAAQKCDIQNRLDDGQLISKSSGSKIDSEGVKSLPEWTIYKLLDIPTENVAAVFWDLKAVHAFIPSFVKTSDIKFLSPSTVEALFEIKISAFLRNDESRITTHVERVANGGYFFHWSMSPGEQLNAYNKAIDGSLLLLPQKEKTLLIYQSISTLKSNTFYAAASQQIEKTIKSTVIGIIKAITEGQKDSEKLATQLRALKSACD